MTVHLLAVHDRDVYVIHYGGTPAAGIILRPNGSLAHVRDGVVIAATDPRPVRAGDDIQPALDYLMRLVAATLPA